MTTTDHSRYLYTRTYKAVQAARTEARPIQRSATCVGAPPAPIAASPLRAGCLRAPALHDGCASPGQAGTRFGYELLQATPARGMHGVRIARRQGAVRQSARRGQPRVVLHPRAASRNAERASLLRSRDARPDIELARGGPDETMEVRMEMVRPSADTSTPRLRCTQLKRNVLHCVRYDQGTLRNLTSPTRCSSSARRASC